MIYKKYLGVIAFVALAGVFLYLAVRFILLLDLEDASYGNISLSFLLFFAETHIIIHNVGFLINIIRLRKKRGLYRFKKIKEGEWPRVDVLLPVKDEPYEVLRNTIITVKTMNYPNFGVFLLDGSQNDFFIGQDKELCEEFGLKLFRASSPKGKAGTINEFLKKSSAKFVAIFDADQNPAPSFLKEVVSIAEYNKKIAFVQTPQLYSNWRHSNIAKTAAMQQSVFYESICESKSSVNAMFCCGTNVLLNREYLARVGGFDERSVTEDFSTSFKLHMAGFKSVYYNHVRVFGMAPETLPAYFKQQARWAKGTAGVLKQVFKNLFINFDKLSLAQWWEYMLSGSYYFVGWSFFILMICPIMFLLFNIPTYRVSPAVYLWIFLPYYTMTFFVFYSTMRARNYHFKDVYTGIIMASLSFPTLMKAIVEGVFGISNKFVTTPKASTDKASFLSLWPWTLMIIFNIIAVAFGLSKLRNDFYAYLINIFWCLYHVFVLSHIFILNKSGYADHAVNNQ